MKAHLSATLHDLLSMEATFCVPETWDFGDVIEFARSRRIESLTTVLDRQPCEEHSVMVHVIFSRRAD